MKAGRDDESAGNGPRAAPTGFASRGRRGFRRFGESDDAEPSDPAKPREKEIWVRRKPKRTDYESATEAHDRGAVLVAAVFDAFLQVYRRRTLDLVRLALTPEAMLDRRQIKEFFSPQFFSTEFWWLWSTIMGSLPQHSATEFRRYINRALALFPDLSDMTGILRTQLDQYEAKGHRGEAFKFSAKKDQINRTGLAVVVFVQDDKTRHVLQAGYVDLGTPAGTRPTTEANQ